MPPLKHRLEGLDANRLEALADGVFAIVMTLLVLDLKAPGYHETDYLLGSIFVLWPNFMGYLLSFILLGIYWLGHRTTFTYIRRVNHSLHWINFLFLLFVGILPFSTKLLSGFPFEPTAQIFYGLNLILIGLLLYWHLSYAARHPELANEPIPPSIIRYGKHRYLVAPACYLVAIATIPLSTHLSLALFGVVPLFYVLPAVQRRWLHMTVREE